MNRSDAIPYVSFVVDDAGCGRELNADPHAIIREGGDDSLPSRERKGFKYASRLIGWQCGFEPLFVAVHSYLDVELEDTEAEDMAREYLEERGWFNSSNRNHEPDYNIE